MLKSKPVLIALEVKSSRDKLERAIQQCKSYLNWADYVYVVIEANGKRDRIKKMADLLEPLRKIGIVIADRGFSIIQHPKRNIPTFSNVEWSSRKEFLVKELQSLGLPVTIKQPKCDIVKALRKVDDHRRETLSKALIATIFSRSQILQYASRSFQHNP